MGKYSNERMYRAVTEVLQSFDLNSKAECADYIRTIAMMFIEDPETRKASVTDLCLDLAEDTGLPYSRIYENVRQAFYRIRKRDNRFNVPDGKLRDFLFYVADKAAEKL